MQKNQYDAVILNVMMPCMDGFSACKEIKKTGDIPVLILSARGEEYDKLFGFEVGIGDYVAKSHYDKDEKYGGRVRIIVAE